MPQEESKRGAHFAKGSAPQTPAPGAASFDNEIRNAWSAAADPGETAVYLRAAGAGTALPRTVLSSARPDETAVFLAAAQSSASVMSTASEAPRAPRPDETAVFLMAAQGKSTPQSAPAARSAKPAAHDDGEPLLSDDEWMPLGSTDPVEIRERLAEVKQWGYSAFKFSISKPSWPLYDPAVTRVIAKAAETIRGELGPDDLLMFDGHGRYDTESAIAIGRALEPYELTFFEEPVSQVDEQAMARVARNVRIPVAAGERLESRWEYRKLLELDAVRVVQPDLAHCNGFLEGYKVAVLADCFSAFVAPHCPMSPVLTVISAHLDAVAPNFLIQERLHLNDWRNDVIMEPLQVRDGFLDLPDKPGWGIELNEELCRKHPKISIRIPRLFREDGAVSDW